MRRNECPRCGHDKVAEIFCFEVATDAPFELPSVVLAGRKKVVEAFIASRFVDREFTFWEKEGFEERRFILNGMRYGPKMERALKRVDGFIDMFWSCKRCTFKWSGLDEREVEKCPRCGTMSLMNVMYGMPTAAADRQISRGEYLGAGCVSFVDDPDKVCTMCGFGNSPGYWHAFIDNVRNIRGRRKPVTDVDTMSLVPDEGATDK